MVGREDPYPRYDRLREISPVLQAEDGALVVTHHADCAAVSRDPRLGHMPPEMLARLGPETVAPAALFLVSDDAPSTIAVPRTNVKPAGRRSSTVTWRGRAPLVSCTVTA